MTDILSGDFKIPIIKALTAHETFVSGANKPLLITGVDENGRKGDYVLKFIGAERMSNEASMRELLAALIAIQMGIKVVTPVVILVSPEFVELIDEQDTLQIARKSLGYNYGSEYLRTHTTILPSQELITQLTQAQTIFAFDITIQNPDRNSEKPNMITNGTEIVIYDHECAFSFVLHIFPNPRPWEIQPTDMHWIGKHILLPQIKGKEFDYEGFSRRFDNLDEKFWQMARNLIPQEWLSDQFDRIKQHFTEICNNKEAFVYELKKLMS